jgi:phosphate starvation-inducible PhoH-like protein
MRRRNNNQIKTPGLVVEPRSRTQAEYIKAIDNNNLVFGLGPAGTGKTFVAVAYAVEMIERYKGVHTKKNSPMGRLVITRPVVEAGENLGFLPGDLTEKVDPYMRPIFDSLYKTMGPERAEKALNDMTIEIAPLAFMRGRTLEDCVVILDEAQNTTKMQMKMFLTRIGDNTKTIVTGDISQVDLKGGRRESGLVQAVHLFPDKIDGVTAVTFDESEVVRHPMVKEIVRIYREFEEGENE